MQNLTAVTCQQILGNSAWAQRIRADIVKVAAHNSGVLITGPTGTGKELIARAIHGHSARERRPFIPVDCASASRDIFASQLFGHLAGAFSGATYAALGCFRAADGGTLFLDEIGDLHPDMQMKLLRVLQERTVIPLGSHSGVPVDVRVLAATNRNLNDEISAGRFRDDLFYRLNVVSLETIPLEERPEDIPPIVDHFLDVLSVNHGLPLKRLTAKAMRLLQTMPWPGNVRQLRHTLEKSLIFSAGEMLDVDDLPDRAGRRAPANVEAAVSGGNSITWDAEDWPGLEDVEREFILRTLEQAGYNKRAAARLLRVDRRLLDRKIKRFRLSIPGRDAASDSSQPSLRPPR